MRCSVGSRDGHSFEGGRKAPKTPFCCLGHAGFAELLGSIFRGLLGAAGSPGKSQHHPFHLSELETTTRPADIPHNKAVSPPEPPYPHPQPGDSRSREPQCPSSILMPPGPDSHHHSQ